MSIERNLLDERNMVCHVLLLYVLPSISVFVSCPEHFLMADIIGANMPANWMARSLEGQGGEVCCKRKYNSMKECSGVQSIGFLSMSSVYPRAGLVNLWHVCTWEYFLGSRNSLLSHFLLFLFPNQHLYIMKKVCVYIDISACVETVYELCCYQITL